MAIYLLVLMLLLPVVFSVVIAKQFNKNEKLAKCLLIAVLIFELTASLLMAFYGIRSMEEGVTVKFATSGRLIISGLSFEFTGFRSVYGVISTLLWLVSTVFAFDYLKHSKNKGRYFGFELATLTTVLGVFYAADLITVFVFFELMSFISYPLVFHEETKEAKKAGATYLSVGIIGGMVMLVGIVLSGVVEGPLPVALMLAGFGVKAAMFPFHIWLLPAHSVAPAPASGLLSCVLPKTGVYGMIFVMSVAVANDYNGGIGFLIDEESINHIAVVLYVLALITMVHGAVCALFSTHIKKIIAGSSVSQLGFILLGVSLAFIFKDGNYYSNVGTMLHMVNHSLAKFSLFMCAGVVMMNGHKHELDEIKGFGKGKPWLFVTMCIVCASIAGVPGFGGYISKTLLHEGIVELMHHSTGTKHVLLKISEVVFLFSGGLTLSYMLKMIGTLFFEEPVKEETGHKASTDKSSAYAYTMSKIMIFIPAVLVLIFGLFPHLTFEKIGLVMTDIFGTKTHLHEVNFFSFENLKGSLVSISIGLLVYFGIVRTVFRRVVDGKVTYPNLWPEKLTLEDCFYRPVLAKIIPLFCAFCARVFETIPNKIVYIVSKKIFKPSGKKIDDTASNYFEHGVGTFVDEIKILACKLFKKERKNDLPYENVMSVRKMKFRETEKLINRGISFGLMLFVIGLSITLIYLLANM